MQDLRRRKFKLTAIQNKQFINTFTGTKCLKDRISSFYHFSQFKLPPSQVLHGPAPVSLKNPLSGKDIPSAPQTLWHAGKCVDKLFILDGCQDGPVRTIAREARKHDTIVKFVPKERLDSMSETGAHQGVIAQVRLMIILQWKIS